MTSRFLSTFFRGPINIKRKSDTLFKRTSEIVSFVSNQVERVQIKKHKGKGGCHPTVEFGDLNYRVRGDFESHRRLEKIV